MSYRASMSSSAWSQFYEVSTSVSLIVEEAKNSPSCDRPYSNTEKDTLKLFLIESESKLKACKGQYLC